MTCLIGWHRGDWLVTACDNRGTAWPNADAPAATLDKLIHLGPFAWLVVSVPQVVLDALRIGLACDPRSVTRDRLSRTLWYLHATWRLTLSRAGCLADDPAEVTAATVMLCDPAGLWVATADTAFAWTHIHANASIVTPSPQTLCLATAVLSRRQYETDPRPAVHEALRQVAQVDARVGAHGWLMWREPGGAIGRQAY
jgi:hypothetical protein